MPYCEKHCIDSKHTCKHCIVEKRQATMMERYGVVNALHSKEIKEKRQKTCLEKYGTADLFSNENIKKKRKETNLKKYGVEETLQLKSIRDKGKETMIEKYGSEHAMNNIDVKQKRIETNLLRFGTENALQNAEILEKRRETNRERYGTDEVLQSTEVKQRVHNTMIERYGVSNPLQCKEIKEKRDNTCEERYGTKDIMHNAFIFEKIAKNSFKKKEYTLPSGKIITYQGYENVALDELLKNINEEEFTNDIKQMPRFMYIYNEKKHRYYPDIYLPNQKKIIEVKSPYTYQKQLEQNNCKKEQVIKDGYVFEFWICDKTKIIEKMY